MHYFITSSSNDPPREHDQNRTNRRENIPDIPSNLAAILSLPSCIIIKMLTSTFNSNYLKEKKLLRTH